MLSVWNERDIVVYTIGPSVQHWWDSGSQVTMDIRESELEVNTHYTGNITVWTLVDQSSYIFTFSECV